MASLAARRPDHDHHPPAEISHRDDAPLAIVGADIIGIELSPAKTAAALAKSSPRWATVQSRLAGSKVIFNGFYVYTLKVGRNHLGPRRRPT